MKALYLLFLFLLPGCLPQARAEVQARFDADAKRWTLANGWVEASFHLTQTNTFEFEHFSNLTENYSWRAPDGYPSSPIRFTLDNVVVDAHTAFLLSDQYTTALDKNGTRQTIILDDPKGQFEVQVDLELYDNQPVLRQLVSVRNLLPHRSYVRYADSLPYLFADEQSTYRLFRVNQWSVAPKQENFEPLTTTLNPNGTGVTVQAGSAGLQCAWLALADKQNRGLFAGFEFDGLMNATTKHLAAQGYIELNAPVLSLFHPLDPRDTFRVPPAFIGLFHGNWDEAGYRTQRFTEAVLAHAPPDPTLFPYIAWDSWGYEDQLDETTLRRNADLAAKLGFELFVIDLGWARNIGDWTADPAKFPSGMRAMSDYVHSLGMKFGLHFALAEADPDSAVLQQHPDWTSTDSYNYFGALSLCLSNAETKQWLIDDAVQMIQTYDVDWILQDGQNMVKKCTKTTHTHDYRDSNYANAVDGLDAVVRAIQKRTPNTYWENCEDGGNMMTFNMVQNYVTSITNDASGALGSRQAVYGATYVFPPRYADRYMGDQDLNAYTTRSFIFGGPWVYMNRLLDMTSGTQDFAAAEIRLFKAIRGKVRDGKVFRLTARPNTGRIDAIQAYDAASNSAVVVVTRDKSAGAGVTLPLQGLNPRSTYSVHFQDDPRILTMTGAQLTRTGVRVNLPASQTAEVVFVDPLDPLSN